MRVIRPHMGPDHDRTARTSHWAASSDPTRWQSSAHSSSAHPSPAPRLIAEGRVSRYACPLSLPAQSHTIPTAETHPSVPQQEHAQSSLGARCVDNRSIVDGPHASTSHPPLPPQRPRERTMPIIMLMPPMCARPPCPLRAATRPAAPRQSSPQEPATQFSTAPAARRRRQQRPVPADTPTSHIERGPLSVLDFSSSQCRPQSVLLLSGTRCPPDFAPLPQGMRNKPSSALGRAPRPGRPQRAASRRHQSAGHLSRGQQIDVRAGTAAEDDTGGTAALPKKGHCPARGC